MAEYGRGNFWRVWISSHGALDYRQTQTPHVALHAICPVRGAGLRHAAAGYALRSHVTLAANVGTGNAGHQVAADAKVANLDLAARVDEHVGRLDVAVDDAVVVLEALEPHYGRVRHLAQDVLGHPAAVQLVDGPAVHVLYAHVDSSLLIECAVEINNVRRHALVQNHELLENRGKLGVVELQANLLHGHDLALGVAGVQGGAVLGLRLVLFYL